MAASPGEAERSAFAAKLLGWYDREGRDLPWRKTRDPYRIWISEIMLQQTGVDTVIPYYERFLERFPGIAALAEAHVDEVIGLWSGLGYYSRARNLHAAAGLMRERFDGRLPDNLDDLMALPGIGRSTAGAILAIAFDRKAPILDGNVRRILCRLYAVEEDPRRPEVEKDLWQWAGELTSAERPHDYSQAIMDLGATLCTPRRPACGRCPVVTCCLAHERGRAEELPLRKKGKAVPQRREVVLILRRQDHFLVHKRPYRGMLGGLWEFPSLVPQEEEPPLQTAQRLLGELGGQGPLQYLGRVRHAYSHFRLETEAFWCAAGSACAKVCESSGTWLPLTDITALAMHGAHKKVLHLLEETS